MTNFTKENLSTVGGYVQYHPYADNYYEGRKFVARFKYARSGSFKAFLIKNFTVEEYFAQLDAGVAPLRIVEEKGYSRLG